MMIMRATDHMNSCSSCYMPSMKNFFDGYVTDSCLLEEKMHEKKSDRVIVARERIAESIAKDLYFQLMTTSSWIN